MDGAADGSVQRTPGNREGAQLSYLNLNNTVSLTHLLAVLL
jgi:hypothetical protein